MNKNTTLKNKKIFNKVINEGKKIVSKEYIIFFIEDENLENTKIGIAVSKKIQKFAVNRNKAKRQIRSMLSDYNFFSDTNFLVVVVLRRGYFIEFNYEENKKKLFQQLNKM